MTEDLETPAPPAEDPTPQTDAAPPEQPPPPQAQAPHEDVEGIKSALIAERRRRQELEAEVQTYRQPPPKPADIPDVSDEDAEKVARHYELYAKDGLDMARAKRIIKDQRDEIRRVAKEAAEEAVTPVRQTAATQASRQNFVWAATQKDADGQPLVDHKVLAEMWARFPAELAADGTVAEIILEAAIGRSARTRGPRPRTLDREPNFSEPSGGQRAGAYTMSQLEKKVAQGAGIKSTDWEARAKTYQPGAPNTLE